MARTIMVTRTVTVTNATAMCVNTDSAEVCNQAFPLGGTFKSEKDMLKAIERQLPENIKAVQIVDVYETNVKYGMTLDDFIANSHVLTTDDNTNTDNTEEG